MKRAKTGDYVTILTVGEKVKAFVPDPLPPTPPLDLSSPAMRSLLDQALLELGRLERAEHEALGRFVAERRWAGVAGVPWKPAGVPDEAAQALANGLRAGGWSGENLIEAPNPAMAAAWLRERLRPGDALLLKASRGVRIEKVLEELKKES